jgi:hypothetical protein
MPYADLNGFEIQYDVHAQGEPIVCVNRLAMNEFNAAVTQFVTATTTEAVR